jgi:L-malate glycosyltransferase
MRVWLFPKWYPHPEDPQIGVFMQKHVHAISDHCSIVTLHVQGLAKKENVSDLKIRSSDNCIEIGSYYLSDKTVFKKLVNALRYYKACRKGINKMQELLPSPDILHSYIMLRTSIICFFLSRKMKTPYVISEQWSGYATGKFAAKNFLYRALSRKLVRQASALTSVSKFLLEKMKANHLINKKTEIIPNIIEQGKLTATKNKTVTEILLVADLVDEIKNISAVIKAVAKISREFPSFILRIVGHGKDEILLKSLAEKEKILNRVVFFEGVKSNEQVYQYLSDCDFLVMNSRFETFSLICAEAMSCGKPVIATRCGGPQEFVTEKCGVLIEPDNDLALESAIMYMLKHYRDYDPNQIQHEVSDKFSRKTAGNKFYALYSEITRP